MFGRIQHMTNAGLDVEIGALAGHLHASTARFIDSAVAFDDSNEWAGIGMRSCAHWLTIATGIDLWNAREMLRVGHALRELPGIHAAFAEGRLSFDKVRAVTLVASGEDEAIWLDIALEASGSQLARICQQFRRSIAVDDPERAALQRARRRVVSWWLDDDGMLALYATLPPEEGRLVLTAIESAVVRPAAGCAGVADFEASASAAQGDSRQEGDPCLEGPADHPYGARRADALVRICERWLDDAAAAAPAGTASAELVVHVDAGTLTGADTGGRCHLEGGPAISVDAARRLGCDATLVTVLERDGLPLDVGRSRRVVAGRMRRLLQLRDQGCRYPGCAVPAADTEGHHVVHWVDGGPTELANLVSLCRFHHHRHHEGAFRIVATEGDARRRAGGFRFETADGRPIGVLLSEPVVHRDLAPMSPRAAAARGGGGSFDLDHTLVILAGNVAVATRRGAEQPSGP
jgi:Domain of unknown function (DUF222)/HNH endonuclease